MHNPEQVDGTRLSGLSKVRTSALYYKRSASTELLVVQILLNILWNDLFDITLCYNFGA